MPAELLSARIRRATTVLSLMLLCSYCGGDAVVGPDMSIVSVSLTPPTATVRLGATSQLTASALNAGGTAVAGTVTYASSDASVVQISAAGVARALKLGTAVVTATAGGRTASATITVIAGFPAVLTKLSTDNQTGTVQAAVGSAPSVSVKDSVGNIVDGVAVTFAVASGGGSIAGASATTNASGVATSGAWTLGSAPGANTVTASVAGSSGPVTTTFTAAGVALVATRLGVSTAPSTAVSAVTLSPGPVVEIRNAAGALVTNATNAVTMSVAASNGLLGTTTVNAVAGIARFTNVAFATAGTQLVTFSSPGLTAATTTVTVAQGAQLMSDTVFFSAVRGAILEGKLAQVTNGGSQLTSVVTTLAIGSTTYDANGSGWLKTTLLRNATPANVLVEPQLGALTAGVHVANVAVTGDNATPGVITVVLNITPLPATALFVTTQPKAGKKREPLIINPVVEFRDSLGLLATHVTDTVRVSILGGSGTLTGTTRVVAVAGVARFTDLTLSDAGNFTLFFESTGVVSANSLNFVVTAAISLKATAVPPTITSGVAMVPSIEISAFDLVDQLVNNEVNLVTVTIAGLDGAVGALNGFTTVATSGGKAVFNDLTLSGHGVFDLTFTSPGLTSTVVRVTVP